MISAADLCNLAESSYSFTPNIFPAVTVNEV
jgi:hypothetical protein